MLTLALGREEEGDEGGAFSLLSLARTMLSSTLARTRCSCIARVSYRALSTSSAPVPSLHPTQSNLAPPHLLTLADLTVPQIQTLITNAVAFKKHYKSRAIPQAGRIAGAQFQEEGAAASEAELVQSKSLDEKTIAFMFSKRSTRTRVSGETAVKLLGAFPLSPTTARRRGGGATS